MDKLTRDAALETLESHLESVWPLFNDAANQEIMINRHDSVWVETGGTMTRVEGCEIDPAQLNRAITVLANVNDKDVTASPLLDARLPGLRIAAALWPVAVHGDMMSIRKHAETRFTADDYLRLGAFDVLPPSANPRASRGDEEVLRRLADGREAIPEFYKWAMRHGFNILFSGGTSSAKTTQLNQIIDVMPGHDRIVTIEDTQELSVTLPNWVALEANQGVSIRDLVKFSLRIRPDRIIVGETRGAEAFDVLEALNTGHDGSVLSLHAPSSEMAPMRFESLVRMSEEGRLMTLDDLRRKIASTFRFFVHAERQKSGMRGPVEIREVLGVEDGRYVTRLLFHRFGGSEQTF
ncbi:type II secretion system protein E [Burkholderia vietnamiensis]|uniref:CpaF family protein n=1 Tax=Burkholderia vietnamiensis TaxID=60552 RepID=UPI000758271D|nr:ATPase, T2SS/T4P/T4SS family [Burkholderia vietnamiensis]KVD99671.1 type II secretion system protein E [Burkholderia vietnamiensis]